MASVFCEEQFEIIPSKSPLVKGNSNFSFYQRAICRKFKSPGNPAGFILYVSDFYCLFRIILFTNWENLLTCMNPKFIISVRKIKPTEFFGVIMFFINL